MRHPESESTTLEFKREIPRNDQIVKTTIGFCNQYGGRIIIGVEDDGQIVGIDETLISNFQKSLHKSICDSSTPPIFPKIYTQRMGEKIVLIVEVSEGANKPYFRTSEGLGKGTYIRLGSATMKATSEIIRELEWLGRGRYFDEMPEYRANRSDLNENTILSFLNSRSIGFEGEVTDEILTSYSLLRLEQSRYFPTMGALLLFGKSPQDYLSESFIICSHFEGYSGRKAMAAVNCTGTLYEQMNTALQFVFSRLYKSYSIDGLRRDEKLEIPEVAVREVLINALVHRNYAINGPIKLSIYEDRLEFFSPGLFPGPLNIENLKQGITYIRNSVITKIFHEAGVIEKLGSGLISLFSSYRDRGLDRPTVIEGLNFVKCILPRQVITTRLKNRGHLADRVEDRETPFIAQAGTSTIDPSEYDMVLDLFKSHNEISMQMVLEKTGWARATAGRRLKMLMENGKIRKFGGGRFSRYRLLSAEPG